MAKKGMWLDLESTKALTFKECRAGDFVFAIAGAKYDPANIFVVVQDEDDALKALALHGDAPFVESTLGRDVRLLRVWSGPVGLEVDSESYVEGTPARLGSLAITSDGVRLLVQALDQGQKTAAYLCLKNWTVTAAFEPPAVGAFHAWTLAAKVDVGQAPLQLAQRDATP